MMQRVTGAVLCFLLTQAPLIAGAQDEEGDEASGEEETGEGAEESASLDALMEGAETDDSDHGGAEGSPDEDQGDGFDENMEDERPPGDPDAFVTLKDKQAADEPDVVEEDEGIAISLALAVGYGVGMDDVNPWGFGFGAVLGFDLGLVSLGVRGGYFLGESVDVANVDMFGNPLPGDVSYTANIFELGIEGGIDIDASDVVTIRPGLGLGLAGVSSRAGTDTNPFFAPMLGVIYRVSESMFVGLNGRFQLIAAEPSAQGLIFMANAGMRF